MRRDLFKCGRQTALLSAGDFGGRDGKNSTRGTRSHLCTKSQTKDEEAETVVARKGNSGGGKVRDGWRGMGREGGQAARQERR